MKVTSSAEREYIVYDETNDAEYVLKKDVDVYAHSRPLLKLVDSEGKEHIITDPVVGVAELLCGSNDTIIRDEALRTALITANLIQTTGRIARVLGDSTFKTYPVVRVLI